MKHSNFCRIGVAVLGLCAALPALADTQFRVRQMTRDDVPPGKGQCDIRLQVDQEVEVSVRRDTVFVRNIAGRGAFDDGSECNAPLPDRDIQGFNFEVKDSRGEIRLLSPPNPRNGFSVVVGIRDSAGGQGRYHFRLTWAMVGDRPTRNDYDARPQGAPPAPGFSWNNTIDFKGNGRGVATLNSFDRRLFDCNMNIDRGGRVVVSFRTDRGGQMNFTGRVTSREGGRLRADVVSEDGRLRGPMFISTGQRDNINSITLEATDGRDRLRLNWDRR